MMSNSLFISIVLTTYNRGNLITRAIKSVINNEYRNLELIIIDDCSIDNTEAVVKSISDSRLRYYKMEENRGVLAARNKGFDLATGDYIATLDDDDELSNDCLTKLVEIISANDGAKCDIFWFDCIDEEYDQTSGAMPISSGVLSFEDYVCGKIKGDFWLVFAAHVLLGKRFDERLRAHESLFWLQLHRGNVARYYPLVLCKKYREHGERLCDLEQRVKQIPQTTLALAEFDRLFGDELKEICPKYYGKKLAYLGLYQLLNNNYTDGRESIKESLKFRLSFKYLSLYLISYIIGNKSLLKIYKIIEGNYRGKVEKNNKTVNSIIEFR